MSARLPDLPSGRAVTTDEAGALFRAWNGQGSAAYPVAPLRLLAVNEATDYASDVRQLNASGLISRFLGSDGAPRLRVHDDGVYLNAPLTSDAAAAFGGALTAASFATASGTGGISAAGALTGTSLDVGTGGISGGAIGGTSLGISGNATVGGTLGVTGAITGASTVQGTRLISTIATGTAPLTVASTTAVANLNASLLGGLARAGFAELTGAAFTGAVSVAGDFAVSTNGLAVTAATNKVRINSASVTGWDLTVGSGGILAEGSSRFQGQLIVSTGGIAATGTVAVTGGITATTSIAATGGISAGASSSFTGGVSIISGGLTVTAGAVALPDTGLAFAGGGSVTRTAANGLVFTGGTGSSRDLFLGNNGGTVVADLLTGGTALRLFDVPSLGVNVATAAGGAQVVSLGAAGLGIYVGSGAPTISAAAGSWYARTDGSTTNDRAYVSRGGTTWTAVITAA